MELSRFPVLSVPPNRFSHRKRKSLRFETFQNGILVHRSERLDIHASPPLYGIRSAKISRPFRPTI